MKSKRLQAEIIPFNLQPFNLYIGLGYAFDFAAFAAAFSARAASSRA
jgi:hypothetical protein